jgi:hypothetical protein
LTQTVARERDGLSICGEYPIAAKAIRRLSELELKVKTR